MKEKVEQQKIGIIGLGNMGRAVFDLLKFHRPREHKFKFFIYSIDVKAAKGATCLKTVNEIINTCDIIFLCVKPQDFYRLPPMNQNECIVISIMAGVTIQNIKKIMGTDRIIRTMPNLPLKIGKGVIGWHAKKSKFSLRELGMIQRIFSSFGKDFFVAKESMLNAITAVSGSGPAYVFLFIQALIRSAIDLGFSRKQAREIVIQTINGSVQYLENEKNVDPEEMIKKVASRGGTTEAAIKSIGINNFYNQWDRAVKKANARAEIISKYEVKRT